MCGIELSVEDKKAITATQKTLFTTTFRGATPQKRRKPKSKRLLRKFLMLAQNIRIRHWLIFTMRL